MEASFCQKPKSAPTRLESMTTASTAARVPARMPPKGAAMEEIAEATAPAFLLAAPWTAASPVFDSAAARDAA